MSYADLRLAEARMSLRNEQALGLARNRLLLRQGRLEQRAWLSRKAGRLATAVRSAWDALEVAGYAIWCGLGGFARVQERACTAGG